jgi:hypothetical protein
VDEELRWPLVNAVYGAGCDKALFWTSMQGLAMMYGTLASLPALLGSHCNGEVQRDPVNGGRRHPDAAWPNNRNQPQMRSCQHNPWSRTFFVGPIQRIQPASPPLPRHF